MSESNMNIRDQTPILIIGGGPVGLGLAADLGWRGIDCVVVEQGDGTIYHPRANTVNSRTMEFCRRWGIAKEVKESGAPPDFPPTIVYATSLQGYEICRIERPTHGGHAPLPTTPERSQRCNQIWFDPILRRLAGGFPSVELRYNCRFQSFEREGDGVVATVHNAASGQSERIAARYLIDCSGGHSGVGKTLGVKQEGRPVLSYHLNIFLNIKELWDRHDKGKAAFYFFVDRSGDYGSLIEIDGNELWRIGVHGEDYRDEPSDAQVRSAIARCIGTSIPYDIISARRWTCRDLVADRFQSPPIFLAGDSVHQHAPSGGFGMNTGMGDAVDLGWKLAGAVAGWGDSGLLESYEAERRPVAQRNVGEATDNVTRTTDPALIELIEEPTPAGAAARRQIADDIVKNRAKTFISDGIALGYRYESPIVIPDGTPPPRDSVMEYQQTSRPGSRAPHAALTEGKSTIDLFGRGFVLLRLGQDAPDPSSLVAAAKQRGVPLEVVTIGDPKIVQLYERPLVLVRPDGHVAWRAATAPEDPLAIVDTIRGAAVAKRATRAA
jgi:2-polyprenyl-6-methoxyphenol hydroxylase-like FAD-dependent oxidoreductase